MNAKWPVRAPVQRKQPRRFRPLSCQGSGCATWSAASVMAVRVKAHYVQRFISKAFFRAISAYMFLNT